jgi:hypothetical protein
VIAYLGRRLPEDPALDRAVRVAVGRGAEVARLAAEARAARAAGRVPPVLLEALRRELYFLGHLYEAFKDDPVLSRVFPGPKVVAAPAPRPAERAARRREVAGELARIRALLGRLAAPMGLARRALAIHDRLAAFEVGALFAAEARTARLVALTIQDRPEAVAALREALDRHDRLVAGASAADPDADPAPLVAIAASLDGVLLAWRADPLLRPLVPVDARAVPPGA